MGKENERITQTGNLEELHAVYTSTNQALETRRLAGFRLVKLLYLLRDTHNLMKMSKNPEGIFDVRELAGCAGIESFRLRMDENRYYGPNTFTILPQNVDAYLISVSYDLKHPEKVREYAMQTPLCQESEGENFSANFAARAVLSEISASLRRNHEPKDYLNLIQRMKTDLRLAEEVRLAAWVMENKIRWKENLSFRKPNTWISQNLKPAFLLKRWIG